MPPQTLSDVISRLPRPQIRQLPAPPYRRSHGTEVGLAVESMRHHMSNEGWELFLGLRHAGYTLAGNNCPLNTVDVPQILDVTTPSVVVMQDVREWRVDSTTKKDFRDPQACFRRVGSLKPRDDIFKLTVIKDAHQRPEYHRDSAQEIGCHAWICYYHPQIVTHLAPYVRPEHVVRVYHTVDRDIVPDYTAGCRSGCILSGAVSAAYPLRSALVKNLNLLPQTLHLSHPGYHRNGTQTPEFLKALAMFKVSICTSSMYGYALRKIVESTACGCVVITDLPVEDKLPYIDDNLVRIRPDVQPRVVADLIRDLCDRYDPARQKHFAELACGYYDYREAGLRLAQDIETLRENYSL